MLKIEEARPDYPQLFQLIHSSLIMILPTAEIHHIGSTAVPGLGGKGIIDILVAIPNWTDKNLAVEKIKSLGFAHIHPEENEHIFMSKVAQTKAGDTHIHLTYIGSPEYQSLLSFRDYLRNHPELVREYNDKKLQWLKQAKGDRKTYAKLKSDWISKLKIYSTSLR